MTVATNKPFYIISKILLNKQVHVQKPLIVAQKPYSLTHIAATTAVI